VIIGRLAICFTLLAGGVFAAGSQSGNQPAGNQSENLAPVILVSIDTLRADHLSAYGYTKIRTPNIDAFAEGGTLFTAIDSQIPLTLPSHTSLFTSTYPFANGVEENGERVPSGLVTLASTLRAHGYQTAAFVGSILLHRRLGLDQGFDSYDSPFQLSPGAERAAGQNPYALRVRRDGALVLRAARQWLATHRGQNVFAFVHLFDLHTPYSVAGGQGALSHPGLPQIAGYDAELAYIDQLLGRFRQALVDGGWWDRSLVVVLSDHGESLGEHGESSHGYFIYQSTLWVPLMFHWPRASHPYPARIGRPGGLIDVAPTILDFLGIPRPPSFAGENLLVESSAHPVFSESVYTRDAFRWAPLGSLRDGPYQWIDAPKPELYDLRNDPAEQRNLIAAHGADAAKLKAELAALVARTGPPAAPGGAAAQPAGVPRNVLESLGYLAAGSQNEPNRPADPKDRMEEYNLFETALEAMYGGRPAAAAASFRKLIAHDPDNTMARYYLGEAWLRSGSPESAIREWNAAVSHDPKYEPLYEVLGTVWLERRDYDRARTYFLQATTLTPGNPDVLRGAALAEERLGMTSQSREHWRKACQLEPEFAECLAKKDPKDP
jgi:choline-sulfatase